MSDASFEDGALSDQALRLAVETADDVTVASTLLQDAVGQTGEISWMKRRRRLVMLLNRFRWEDAEAAKVAKRKPERVRAALVCDDVLGVRARGLDPSDGDTIFSLLSIAFEPGDAPSGRVVMTLAGDGELALDVECLDMRLIDLTRPWNARGTPDHGGD